MKDLIKNINNKMKGVVEFIKLVIEFYKLCVRYESIEQEDGCVTVFKRDILGIYHPVNTPGGLPSTKTIILSTIELLFATSTNIYICGTYYSLRIVLLIYTIGINIGSIYANRTTVKPVVLAWKAFLFCSLEQKRIEIKNTKVVLGIS